MVSGVPTTGVADVLVWCGVVHTSTSACPPFLEDKLAVTQEAFDMLKPWQLLKGFECALGYTEVTPLFRCLSKCSNR